MSFNTGASGSVAMDISFLFKPAVIVNASSTYVIPESGIYRFDVYGAGGSGAALRTAVGATSAGVGAGGGAYAIKTIYLPAGTNVTCTIGLGGNGVTNSTVNTSVSGNPGGTTSVTCTGVNITCTGGLGGTGSTPGNATITGVAGGTATGGDYNYPGGNSGTAVLNNYPTQFSVSGGGAAGRALGSANSPNVTNTTGLGGGNLVNAAGVDSKYSPFGYSATVSSTPYLLSAKLPALYMHGGIAGVGGANGPFGGTDANNNNGLPAAAWGGGTGATYYSAASGSVYSGKGGDGLVIIERIG